MREEPQFGALDLILLRIHRLQAHLVFGEHPVAHAARQPGLAHARSFLSRMPAIYTPAGALALLNPLLTVLSVAGLLPRVDFLSLGTIHGGVRMVSGDTMAVFVWRCPVCSGVYEGEALFFLHTDGEHRYCPCGGRLVESVEPAGSGATGW